jgi:hypothetical protein
LVRIVNQGYPASRILFKEVLAFYSIFAAPELTKDDFIRETKFLENCDCLPGVRSEACTKDSASVRKLIVGGWANGERIR